MGQLSFIMYLYTALFEDLIEKCDIGEIVYADDTQIYMIFSEKECPIVIPKIKLCLNEI